jgi:microcystin-dependent protein
MRISTLVSTVVIGLFFLGAGAVAFAAPIVVIPGEGAGYVYYSEASASAPAAAPATDTSFVGMIAAFSVTPPTDTWVVCEGQTISSGTYPELVEFLAGAAAASAVMPDYRGYFLRGVNTTPAGLDNGRTLGSVQGDAIRNITGQAAATGSRGLTDGTTSGAFTRGTYRGGAVETAGSYPSKWSILFDASRVVPTADEVRPVNIAVIYAMRAK